MKFHQLLKSSYDLLPSYFILSYSSDSIESVEIEFETIEELLKIDFINNWKSNPRFFRFVQDGSGGSDTDVMVEYDEGKTWYVLGKIEGKVDLLPQWEPKRE